MRCLICGHSITQNKKGRKKEYCSPNCQHFNKYKSAMEDCFSKIEFSDSKHLQQIRGDFFSLANSKNQEWKRLKNG